jgi:hypothetical protein
MPGCPNAPGMRDSAFSAPPGGSYRQATRYCECSGPPGLPIAFPDVAMNLLEDSLATLMASLAALLESKFLFFALSRKSLRQGSSGAWISGRESRT